MKHIVKNYRDESFILQFLGPKVVKQFKLFSVNLDEHEQFHKVTQTHDEEHLKEIRQNLSKQYDLSRRTPHIEVVNVDWEGSRKLTLKHYEVNGVLLSSKDATKTGGYLQQLWGHDVAMEYEEEE